MYIWKSVGNAFFSAWVNIPPGSRYPFQLGYMSLRGGASAQVTSVTPCTACYSYFDINVKNTRSAYLKICEFRQINFLAHVQKKQFLTLLKC